VLVFGISKSGIFASVTMKIEIFSVSKGVMLANT
jgi:hypothetical protein